MCPTQWDWPLGPLSPKGVSGFPFSDEIRALHIYLMHISLYYYITKKKLASYVQHKEMSRQNGLDERNYRSHPGTSILACYCDFCSTSTLYAEKRRPSFCLFPFHDMSNHRVDMASHWGLKQTLDLCLSEPEPGFESQNTKKRVFLPKKL